MWTACILISQLTTKTNSICEWAWIQSPDPKNSRILQPWDRPAPGSEIPGSATAYTCYMSTCCMLTLLCCIRTWICCILTFIFHVGFMYVTIDSTIKNSTTCLINIHFIILISALIVKNLICVVITGSQLGIQVSCNR